MRTVVSFCLLVACCSYAIAESDEESIAAGEQYMVNNMISSLARLETICKTTGSEEICAEADSLRVEVAKLTEAKGAGKSSTD